MRPWLDQETPKIIWMSKRISCKAQQVWVCQIRALLKPARISSLLSKQKIWLNLKPKIVLRPLSFPQGRWILLGQQKLYLSLRWKTTSNSNTSSCRRKSIMVLLPTWRISLLRVRIHGKSRDWWSTNKEECNNEWCKMLKISKMSAINAKKFIFSLNIIK